MIYVFYLDYISKKEGNMHGGNVYSKRTLQLLIESGLEVSVLLPSGYHISDAEERKLFTNENVVMIERSRLNHGMELQKNSILFFPLLRVKNMYLLKEYKKMNPDLRIFITVHGLRLLDLKPDSYDRYYLNGLKYHLYDFYAPIRYAIRSFVYKKFFSKKLLYADKVFTVSNYSLNQIVRNSHPRYITVYYCGSNLKINALNDSIEVPYFLFVSAGRAEKNFLRTLEAFIKFKKMNNDKIFYLYVTGLDEKDISNIKRYKEWNKDIVKNWVKIWDYVESKDLELLYKNSYAIVYTSKSEGFGLPAIEACCSGVPLIASYRSAIPEVLEAAAYYVNPYDVNSILKGFHALSNEECHMTYKKRIIEYQSIMNQRNEYSDNMFVQEFTNDMIEV